MENVINGNNRLIVISGSSGVGKGTLLSLLMKKFSDMYLSVSVTTRIPRAGELHGIDYFFTSKENFQNLIEKDEFLEWSEFAGNYYGTYASAVKQALTEGKDVILEIDAKGALQIKEKMPQAILIFILPPSIEDLQSRLFKRSTESQEEIQKRLNIVKEEMKAVDIFDYQLVNDDINDTLARLESIITAEKCRTT